MPRGFKVSRAMKTAALIASLLVASPALAMEYKGRRGDMLLHAQVERDGSAYRVRLTSGRPTCTGDVHLTGKVGKVVLLSGEQCTAVPWSDPHA
jgi:hypothetical protein